MASPRPCPTTRGTSVFVGTVSPDGLPAGCRAIALKSEDELKSAVVFVPIATSRDVVANAASTRRISVVSSFPLDHLTTQIKGRMRAVRLAEAQEEDFLRDRLEGFADVLHVIGVPRRLTRSINYWPAFAIEFEVDEIFDQTPGPNAGNTLS